MEVIKEMGVWSLPIYELHSNRDIPQITNSAAFFNYEGIIIYEGVHFLYGAYDYDNSKHIVVEVTTGATALRVDEIGRIKGINKIGNLLAAKIQSCGRTVHEVVRDCTNNRYHLDLWKINMFL